MSHNVSAASAITRLASSALAVLVAVAAFGLVAASAQQPSALEISSVEHDPAGSVVVTISGPGAGALAAGELSASVDGIPLGPAEPLGSDGAPAQGGSLVIAIETSSSMLFGLLEQAQAAAIGLVDGLGPADRVAVVSYGDEVEVVSGFTTDHAQTRAAIESLTLTTFAAIYDGVDTAVGLAAGEAASSQRAIVLLGWGWEFGGRSTTTRQASTAAALAADATIFWAPLGADYDGAYFGELTGSSAGRVVTGPEVPGLASEVAGPSVPTEQRFQFSAPVLPSGARTLALAIGDEQIASTFEVTNEGLIRIGELAQSAPDEPFVAAIESLVSLSELELTGTAGGQPIEVDATAAELRLDPFAFEPGTLSVTLTALANGQPAATQTATLDVPALPPQLTIEATEIDGESGVLVRWLTQGAAPATLSVSINGEVAFETAEAEATVAVPDGGDVVATLTSPGGAELATRGIEIDASGAVAPVTPTGSTQESESGGGGVSTRMIAVIAIAVAAIVGAALLVWRARQPGRPPEFDAGAALEGVQSVIAVLRAQADRLRERFARRGTSAPAEQHGDPSAIVVVRDGRGEDRRVPVWESQLSIGASRQCDITLSGDDVRFVHLILTAVGDDAYRAFRFGPVVLGDGGVEISDDELIERGQWIDVGGIKLSVEAKAPLTEAA